MRYIVVSKKSTQSGVLVCVTDQFSCERLIVAGRKIADNLGLPLEVLSIQPEQGPAEKRGLELEYLFEKACENNAEMTIYYHNDAALMAAGHIRKYHVRHIVTGMPDGTGYGFMELLHQLCPDLPLTMVTHDNQMYTISLPAGLTARAVS